MDRILKILKKENGPWASSAPALELSTIIFKHVYWYMQQTPGERLQDQWSSGFEIRNFKETFKSSVYAENPKRRKKWKANRIYCIGADERSIVAIF